MSLIRKVILCSLIALYSNGIKASIDTILVSPSAHNGCYDSCLGSAILQIISSTSAGSYRVVWNGDSLNGPIIDTVNQFDTIFNLCAGNYTVVVTDISNGFNAFPVYFNIGRAPPIFGHFDIVDLNCHNDTNGSITANMSGGTGPYNYAWSTSPIDTTNEIDSLLAGIYILSVTDSLGCSYIDSAQVIAPDSVQVNIGGSNISCKGFCDGSVFANPSGGNGIYSYLWSNSNTNQLVSNLCPGTFFVTVTDSNGCSSVDTVTISEADSLLSTFNITHVTCSGNCDGNAIALATGGRRPYSYHWAGYNDIDSSLENACSGMITATISDSSGCYFSENIQINAPAPFNLNDSIFSAACGDSNGVIKLFPTGGSGTYHFLWLNQKAEDTLSSIDSLKAGVYQVVLFDSLMCSDTFSLSLNNDTSGIKDLGFSINNTTCADSCDGAVSAYVIGGLSPFSYLWSPGNTTDSTIFGLCAGMYTLEVTDSNGCKRTETINLSSKSHISNSFDLKDISCKSQCDGEALSHLSGGTAPYTYSWNGNASTGASAVGLCEGPQAFEAMDAIGCIVRDTAIVTASDTLKVQINTTNATCWGVCDGLLDLTIIGGTAPYFYQWSNGEKTSSISRLCEGNYWVNVTDASGCSVVSSVILGATSKITANETVFNANCNLNDGAIKLNPSGGVGPYSFLWQNGTFSDSLYGISAGVLIGVKIKDNLGCTLTDSFIVSNTSGPSLTLGINHESCTGKCDGSVSISVNGGKGPLSYNWLSPINNSNSKDVSGLCPGQYHVNVTDGDGCITATAIGIDPAPQILADFDLITPSCIGNCDGSIVANIQGGLPPYNYNWSGGLGNSKAVSNLCDGSYTLQLVDNNGCLLIEDIELKEPEPINVVLSTSNLTCYNVCDGIVSSAVQGGSGKYTYLWSTGATGKSLVNVCEGTYWLTVTDENGCTGIDTISLANGIPITASFTTVNADCGQRNGSLTVSANGGNGIPHSYNWSTGDTNLSVQNLSAGIYYVNVTDNIGCQQQFQATVSNVNGPNVADTSIGVSCFGICDGKGIATGSGTTAPYTTQWSDPLFQIGDTAHALCAGLYTYSITDSAGCMTYDSLIINEPNELLISANIVGPSCVNDSNGQISISVTGAQGTLSYLWSTGDTVMSIDSLPKGTYWVSVNDTSGCFVTDTFELLDPVGLTSSVIVTSTSCFNSCDGIVRAIISGGTAPYTYQWNDPANQISNLAFGLCGGYVSLTVTDADGCSNEDSVLITAPSPISVTPILNNPTCPGGNDGSISLSVSGGVPPYSFQWSNGHATSLNSNLEKGTYSVVVIDSAQCTNNDTFMLNDPALLNVTVTVTKPNCNTGNGSAAATVTGGSGNYSFIWNTIPTNTSSTASNLWAGIYKVTITDNITGCSQEEIVIVNNAGAVNLTSTIVNESCPGSCNGAATIHAGVGKFIFQWNDPALQTDSAAINLCIGTYIVQVTDTSNYCVSFDTVTINADTFSTSISGLVALNCFGDCTGSVSITAMGGLPPISYTWNSIPVQNTQTANDLCGGTYIGTATDSNNCSSSQIVIINEPDSIGIDIIKINDALCYNTCNGAVRLNITGGTAPYTIFWDGVRGQNANTTLCPGNHTISITDFNNCTQNVSFDISNPVAITSGAIVISPGCSQYNGSISLNPSGGVGPYFYSWSNGSYNSAINDLFAGIYTVIISDVNGCSESFTFFLSNPNAPVLQFENNTVKCFGDCNGVARVTLQGGVSPFTYKWDHVPVSTVDSLTNLCSGTYFIKVTDATGCIAFGADTVTEPPVLDGNMNKISDGCGGKCDGEAELIPLGGTMPYNYSWNTSPPQTSSIASNLCAGMVAVILTDINDCTFEDSILISPPPELLIDSIDILNTSCFTNLDGEATVYISGGTVPYGYAWGDGQLTQTAIGLDNGLISILITDFIGCTAMDTVTIGVTDTVLVEAFVDSFVCIGGQATLVAQGTGATIFNWFADSSGTLLPIASGASINYIVTDSVTIILRGQNNAVPPCFDLDSSYIFGIPAPVIDAGPDVTIDEGGFTQLLASPFLFNGSYAWSPSSGLNDTAAIDPIARPQETTTYVLIGTNEYGCSDKDSITIFVVDNVDVINGFSPNGDGVNDTWELPFLANYPNAIVEVYNRWGLQVFRSDGYVKPWDGAYEGDLLPSASYYFVIDYNGDGAKVETGAVTILY